MISRNDGDALECAGILSLTRFLTRESPRVVMYHRFGAVTDKRRIGLDLFEKQLVHLRKNFKLMTITELARGVRKGGLPSNAAAITVDDCYQDFYMHAWPILRKHGVPVTVYAVSGFISRRNWLWPDVIHHIVRNTKKSAATFIFNERVFVLAMKDEIQKDLSWEILADECLAITNGERVQFLKDLAICLDVEVPEAPVDDYQAMTWDQLIDIDRQGSEVGAHTVSHPRLTSLSLDAATQEIAGSKSEIESHIGREVTAFSYPNGTSRDFNEQIKQIVRQCGYENATTTVRPNRKPLDLYAIGRIGAETSFRRFRRSVSGLTQVVSSIRGGLSGSSDT